METSPAESAPKTLHPPGRTEPRPKSYYFGLVVLLASALEITGFEFTFVFPAIPHIAREFQTTQVSWTFTILYLVGALAVPALGKLSDIVGKKRVLLGTMVAFAIGSALCALTHTYAVFLLGRGLQAVALAASVIAFGLVRDLLPAHLVPLGLGGLATGVGVSTLVGPLLGGWLIDNYGFRSCFVFLGVYIVVVIALMLAFLPETAVRIRQRIDLVGGALLGLGAAGLMLALSAGGTRRWWIGAVALLFVVAFVLSQRRVREPLMDPALLARPALVLTLVTTACLAFPISGWAYLMPQLLQTPSTPATAHGFGLTASQVALWQGLPQGIGSMAAGVLGGLLARRFGPRLVLLLSGLCFAAPCLTAAWTLGADSALIVRTCALFVGVATGFFFSSTQNLIVDAVPADRQGVSGAMNFTVQSIFGGIATASLAAVLLQHATATAAGSHYQLFSASGYRFAFVLCAALPVVGIVVAVLRRDGRTPATGGVVSGMH